MRVKLDENLPATLADVLTQLGHDTDTLPQEGLTGEPDDRVWQAAIAAGRMLVTQDLDFSDIRKFAPGTHHGLMLVRLDQPSRSLLLQRIHDVFRTENVEAWMGCFVIVSRNRIRIRRP